ncbi:radical SAM protein [Sphingomonas quercus]|uniref:Radical SAM protein n=1 Tax=Sphingomonas quercus TaxID=2842451 RepID=A0ABS6BPS7_9SPHN|nr:radical SAM/SPASM domain-containing protein [Sphingomonas quercus]MBU3079416.1 hypothetical protein [Sphingomonas quercus]
MTMLRARVSDHLLRAARYQRHRDRFGWRPLFQLAALADPANGEAARELRRSVPVPRADGLPAALRFMAIGTTGTCNASCIHCPTGKAETAHVPRGEMPMELFRKLIDGIAEAGLTVTDQISFGLFGDGLVDRQVIERARYLKERLPEVQLSVNTNGAAYAPRHAELAGLVDVVGLHCESLVEETYNLLMQPLRLARVKPKLEAILRDFPGKVHVSVPVSRRNLGELEAIRAWFMERGAQCVVFDPLSNRCAEDQTLFDSLALAPAPVRCGPDITNDLIVDCDGLVLACCQDFRRLEPVGNLLHESVADTLRSASRAALNAVLAEGRHCEKTTCGGCRGDMRTPDFPFDQLAAA